MKNHLQLLFVFVFVASSVVQGRWFPAPARTALLTTTPRGGAFSDYPSDANAAVEEHIPSVISSSSDSSSVSIPVAEHNHPIFPPSISPPPISPPVVESAATFRSKMDNLFPPKKVSSKWDNVRERTAPAVLMLAGLFGWVKLLKTKGVIALVAILQTAMFSEATSVVNVATGIVSKWWYFAAFWANTSGRILLNFDTSKAAYLSPSLTNFIGYGMGVASIVGLVLQLNSDKSTSAATSFQNQLGGVSGCVTSLIVLVGQSSFWLLTLRDYGLAWILFPAMLVIVNDTMAYVFGYSMGKHPLLKTISPKKTWEGFIGAAVSTMALAVPLQKAFSLDNASVNTAIAIAAFVSVVAPFGGYLASVTKRAHDKKDFGALIPGHGGIVDRLDCQVMTAPFVYLYLKQAAATAAV